KAVYNDTTVNLTTRSSLAALFVISELLEPKIGTPPTVTSRPSPAHTISRAPQAPTVSPPTVLDRLRADGTTRLRRQEEPAVARRRPGFGSSRSSHDGVRGRRYYQTGNVAFGA